MRAALGSVVAALVAAAVASAESPGPGETVEAYYAALAAGDAAAAEALLAPDAVVLESGVVESRSEYLSHHLAADVAFARATSQTRSDVRVVLHGDTAWVSARTRSQGELRGRSVRSLGAELIVLSRSAAGWRIRAIHWSSQPEPAGAEPPSAAGAR